MKIVYSLANILQIIEVVVLYETVKSRQTQSAVYLYFRSQSR